MSNSCEFCRKRKLYLTYPIPVCSECMSKVPGEKILAKMDISYHEAICSNYFIRQLTPDDTRVTSDRPIFWYTGNKAGVPQRCGTDIHAQSLMTKFKLHPEEIFIHVIKAYWPEERGLRDMKKLKQNFKRIRAGIRFYHY